MPNVPPTCSHASGDGSTSYSTRRTRTRRLRSAYAARTSPSSGMPALPDDERRGRPARACGTGRAVAEDDGLPLMRPVAARRPHRARAGSFSKSERGGRGRRGHRLLRTAPATSRASPRRAQPGVVLGERLHDSADLPEARAATAPLPRIQVVFGSPSSRSIRSRAARATTTRSLRRGDRRRLLRLRVLQDLSRATRFPWMS